MKAAELSQLKEERDRLRHERDALLAERAAEKAAAEQQAREAQATAEQLEREARADELLSKYAFANDDARAAMRELLLSNRESAVAILGGMPRVDAVKKPVIEMPPPPQHDPASRWYLEDLSKEERAKNLDEAIKALQKSSDKFSTYTAAREEIRRTQPELFS
jgi:hypothetical protein